MHVVMYVFFVSADLYKETILVTLRPHLLK
jgi:hypothetical protein